jgi:hypothetical protein
MKLIHLKPTRGDASERLKLYCPVLNRSLLWNEAAQAGWMVDIEGKPFHIESYYSPERLKAEGINPNS